MKPARKLTITTLLPREVTGSVTDWETGLESSKSWRNVSSRARQQQQAAAARFRKPVTPTRLDAGVRTGLRASASSRWLRLSSHPESDTQSACYVRFRRRRLALRARRRQTSITRFLQQMARATGLLTVRYQYGPERPRGPGAGRPAPNTVTLKTKGGWPRARCVESFVHSHSYK